MIRLACKDEIKQLNELACDSEAHWGYDEATMTAFKEVYEIKSTFVEENPTYVLQIEGELRGFYTLIVEGHVGTLEYFYIRADDIGQGYGKKLWEHLVKTCEAFDVDKIVLVTSPQAFAFYEKMGAIKTGEVESLLNKERMIPTLMYVVKSQEGNL